MVESRDHMIRIEIAYACAQEAELISLNVKVGTTVMEAIELSSIQSKYPCIDFSINKTGIYGRQCLDGTMLKEGDRVEIYRPLQVDPKKNRRRRASTQGSRNR